MQLGNSYANCRQNPTNASEQHCHYVGYRADTLRNNLSRNSVGTLRVTERRILKDSVGLRTFIVEDNPTIRENLVAALQELAGIEAVGDADSEDSGVRWLHENAQSWDLAIVDIFLKQGSGLGVVGACQKRLDGQKIVVLSNYATQDIRRRCAQLHVDAVFDKSNEIDGLIDFCLAQEAQLAQQRKSASSNNSQKLIALPAGNNCA
jgi:two-component system, OmpR family, response regulator